MRTEHTQPHSCTLSTEDISSGKTRQLFLEAQLKNAAYRYLTNGNRYVFLACTGAGAGLQEVLWQVPGASKMLAGAVFPYALGAPERFTQRPIEKIVSLDTAMQLANASFLSAQRTQSENNSVAGRECIGFGLTAAVVTSRDRKGEDQIFMALRSAKGNFGVVVKLEKSAFDREETDRLVSHLAMNLLLEEAGLPQVPITAGSSIASINFRPWGDGSTICSTPLSVTRNIDRWNGREMLINSQGTLDNVETILSRPHILIPASLNPFHWGHDAVALAIAARVDVPIIFEISLDNVDKPEVPIEEGLRRADALRGRWPVLITKGCPLMIEKTRRYGSSFAVGTDVAKRVVSTDPRYLKGATLEEKLQEFKDRNVKFYVATRSHLPEPGKPVTESIDQFVPPEVRPLFEEIPLRCNVSSTALRKCVAQPI